jgi:hypothetical protein
MVADTIDIRVELRPEGKEQINELSEKIGMTQVALLSAVLEWFAAQPETVQAVILGCYPKEIEADVAKIILKQMSSRR